MNRIPQGCLGILVADCGDLLARDAQAHYALMREQGESIFEWVMSAPSLTTATDRLGAVLDNLTDETPDEGEEE